MKKKQKLQTKNNVKEIKITNKKRNITMKLKAYLSILVAFSLALSSCDKKNATLVNRRTATPERIEEIKEEQRAKTKEVELQRLADIDALNLSSTTRQRLHLLLSNSTTSPADCHRLINILDRLNNAGDVNRDLISILINTFDNLSYHPAASRVLIDILSNSATTPADCYDLINTFDILSYHRPERRRLINILNNSVTDPTNRSALINILNNLGGQNQQYCHRYRPALINILDILNTTACHDLISILSDSATNDNQHRDLIDVLYSLPYDTDDRRDLIGILKNSVTAPADRSALIDVLNKLNTTAYADRSALISILNNLGGQYYHHYRPLLINILNRLNTTAYHDLISILSDPATNDDKRLDLIDVLTSLPADTDDRRHLIAILTHDDIYRQSLIGILKNSVTAPADRSALINILKNSVTAYADRSALISILNNLGGQYYHHYRPLLINILNRLNTTAYHDLISILSDPATNDDKRLDLIDVLTSLPADTDDRRHLIAILTHDDIYRQRLIGILYRFVTNPADRSALINILLRHYFVTDDRNGCICLIDTLTLASYRYNSIASTRIIDALVDVLTHLPDDKLSLFFISYFNATTPSTFLSKLVTLSPEVRKDLLAKLAKLDTKVRHQRIIDNNLDNLDD